MKLSRINCRIDFIQRWLLLCVLVTASSIVNAQLSVENTLPEDAGENSVDTKTDTCLQCHNTEPVNAIFNTPHARRADPRTPFAGEACESCHGDSTAHINGIKQKDGRRSPPSILFGMKAKTYPVTEVAEQNKVCLDCHKSNKTMNWHSSQHQFADLSCSSCHTLHSAHDPVLDTTTQADTCYACHQSQRAQSHRPSRHPIKEGKMTCTSCHNAHGAAGPALLVKNTVNETCYQCHAEKRGPFLWEHQPVREDCTHCHAPHGATQLSMLKTRTPFLCSSCHSENYHPSTLRSGAGVPPRGADNFLLGKDCMNCHANIHGSNHPSGAGLTR